MIRSMIVTVYNDSNSNNDSNSGDNSSNHENNNFNQNSNAHGVLSQFVINVTFCNNYHIL